MKYDLKDTLYRTQLLCIRSISLNLEYLQTIKDLKKIIAKQNLNIKKLKKGV